MLHTPLGRLNTLLVAVLLFALVPVASQVRSPNVARASHAAGAASIFVGGDLTGSIDVFAHDGMHVDGWDGNVNVGDELAVGDPDGDGVDEVMVAGDDIGVIDIFDQAGILLNSIDGDFSPFDGFASGDVNGDGTDEILVAGEGTGTIDIFSFNGTKIQSFDGGFTLSDGFAVGNVTLGAAEEILVAGDGTGTIDIFDFSGAKIQSFDGDFTFADGFAAGDLNGDLLDEILVAGDVTGTVDIFNVNGTKIRSFGVGFSFDDGFAVGDADGDGFDDIVVGGNISDNIDIFDFNGTKLQSFDGGFTPGDRLAVGRNPYPDADLDGLLDAWETVGLDVDADGTIDVDLPAMGADPRHKDLFLELDYDLPKTPTRADIQAMKAAFAAAPLANPDGTTGVNLWVDMGGLVDPAAREGQAPGTCADGIDNGGDGLVDGGDKDDCRFLDASVEDPGPGTCQNTLDDDADGLFDGADPDCLVGDNLGGGNAVAPLLNCGLNSIFYLRKNGDSTPANPANFNPNRQLVFRYAISGSKDSGCEWGGWAEIGGNDFVDYNHDGGTIMHELGHTLGLRHGGDENDNCKPNYVSVMNYDHQLRIRRAGGGNILDYSPPRIALDGSTRGNAPLATLEEDNLNEALVLDSSDNQNRFVFVNGDGEKKQNPLITGANWDDFNFVSVDPVTVNIDTVGTNGRPKKCKNGSSSSTLTGADDWSRVSIQFRQFGDLAGSAINPTLEEEPTLEDLLALEEELNTTDLELTVVDSPDPVAAGTQLTYTLAVDNAGPNPATSVRITDTLPAGVTYASGSTGCSEAAGVVTCVLGELLAGDDATVTITVDVAADLVYTNGAPKTIANSASVENLAGPDSDTSDNTRVNDTLVIAVADLEIVSSGPVNAPLEMLIGEPVQLTLESVVTSHGPSSPIDVDVDVTASATSGATVTPANASQLAVALASNEQRALQETFTLECSAPGQQTFTFDTAIAPDRPDDVDPDLSNNAAQATVTVDCVIPVVINIRPHGFPNAVNLNSDVTLAVLTTEAGEYGLPLAVDATTIDPLSVRFGLEANLFNASMPAGGSEIHQTGHLERSYELDEKTRDADLDMVMHFDASESGLTAGTTEACVKGTLTSGGTAYTFFGCDAVVIQP
jgi:uncharacterized repeat protein (TIGR01451 family)